MPFDLVVLLGAGGHAKVVYDAMLAANLCVRIEVRDDDASRRGSAFLGQGVMSPIGPVDKLGRHVHVAIGENRARAELARQCVRAGKELVRVVHPSAIVSGHAEVAPGAFIAAGAVVAPAAHVAECAIINHGAVVDHDCAVGAYAHVAPNATLGGGVKVGEGALIGAGAVLLPGVSVGKWAIVGAGAVVTRPVAEGATVLGAPAKRKRDA
jgi:sugar O-acyltransferase (sialic acid O-acetyltransferase NeuD family)